MFKRKASVRKNKRINRRKDSSKGKLKVKSTHIDRTFLDSLFSPAILVKKHYNGVNSATWHSNIASNAYATHADSKVKIWAKAGDCVSLSALPGRQIYCEFMMFPQISHSGLGRETASTNMLECLGVPLSSMMDKAFQFSNFMSTSAYNFNPNDQLSSQTSTFSDIMATGYNRTAPTYDADASKLRQTKFYYEGGTHVHEFTNPTNLPLYFEVIEYKPRSLMAYSTSGFNSTVGSELDVIRLPGLYETIHPDRCDQKAWEYNTGVPLEAANGSNMATGSLIGLADNSKYDSLFNELDDKDFKLSGKMALTNLRWIILNKVRVRVDPGNVYKYTVEHKPFSFTPADLLQYNNHYRLHATTAVASVASLDQATAYGYNPLFSRGLAVRVIGSKAFVSATTNTAQRNSFGVDANGGETVNNVQPNPGNDNTAVVNMAITAQLTHAPTITHACTETHKFRMRAKPDTNIKFYSDLRPNASSIADVQLSDVTRFMNPETNNVEAMDFDENI